MAFQDAVKADKPSTESMPAHQSGLAQNSKLIPFCACAVLTILAVMGLLRMAVILAPELYYGGFEGLWDAIAFQGFGPDKKRMDEHQKLVLTASAAEQRAFVIEFAAVWLVVVAVAVGGIWGLRRTSKGLFQNTEIESPSGKTS